jgi:hypothetical protein
MMEGTMRRFGNPDATPSAVGRSYVISVACGLAICLGLAVIAIVELAQRGDVARAIGLSIGLALVGAAVATAQAVAFRRWRPLYQMQSELRRRFPGARTLAVRLTLGASFEVDEGWPIGGVSPAFPKTGIVTANAEGLALWDTASLPDPFLQLPWSAVSEVTFAEFGDYTRAFPVIAFVSPSGKNALVVQVVRLIPPLVFFPSAAKLAKLATQLDRMRVGASL